MADRLEAELLKISDERRDFEAARREWAPRALLEDSDEKCLCGRPAGKEACSIEHARTRKAAIVGSNCAARILGYPTRQAFSSWRALQKDPSRPPAEALVAFAFAAGAITPWERDFCAGTRESKSLTPDQTSKRLQINRKILRALRPGPSA